MYRSLSTLGLRRSLRRSQSRRRQSGGGAANPPHAHVETLEDRQLNSVTVPSGYAQILSLTLDAVTLATQSIPVQADRDYFFKATGRHVASPTPELHADAASVESYVGLWSEQRRLHITSEGVELADWGYHTDDSEYGAAYHANTSTMLSAFLTDSYAQDNQGSISLTVYRKVLLGTMTGTESGGGASVTASGNNPGGTATLFVTPNSSNQATVLLSALVSPNTTEALNNVAWSAYDASGNQLGGDTFDSGGDSITFTFNSPTDVFTVRGGTDINGNGVFDYGTETATRTITVQRVS